MDTSRMHLQKNLGHNIGGTGNTDTVIVTYITPRHNMDKVTNVE